MIGFRVDANEVIATGHLMRCIAIALACIKRGEKCIFFLAEEKETFRLEERGIPYRILNTDWKDMNSEKSELFKAIKEEQPDCMVVDSYQVTGEYLSWLDGVIPVLYIDDMVKERYSVTAVLHYSQWEDSTDCQKQYAGTKTKVLAGMKYVPLREEFAKQKRHIRTKSILITTGGTDPYNIAGRLLQECIGKSEFTGYTFQTVIGSMNQYEKELRELEKNYKNVFIHKNIKNIDEYMACCESAVSAGGTTLFELCASGIPTVCFSFADNQQAFAQEMDIRKIMLYAGDARENGDIEQMLCKQLVRFINDSFMRQQYSNRMMSLVDGHGCERIADFLIGVS